MWTNNKQIENRENREISAVERALSSKERDLDELLLLIGDTCNAKVTAIDEKHKVLERYKNERKKGDKASREKQQVVQLRGQIMERLNQQKKPYFNRWLDPMTVTLQISCISIL